jgi:NTP pyrophosphatase (non-canonical NTP hydrolase)
MNILQMVEDYRFTAKQDKNPTMGAKLIVEEYIEWYAENSGLQVNGEPKRRPEKELKELADLVYVCFGLANSKGWDLNEAIKRVHENNMGRMYQEDGSIKYNQDGKVIKCPDYPKVSLKDLV